MLFRSCVYSAHTSEPLLIRLRRPYLPICDKPPACLPYGLSSVTSREAWRPIYISSGALELLSSLVLVFFNIIRRCTSAAVAQSSPSHYMPYKETPEGWCTIETMRKFRRTNNVTFTIIRKNRQSRRGTVGDLE